MKNMIDLCGCVVAALMLLVTYDSTAAPSGGDAKFTDPFAYCSAVGTIDAPDARYTGAKLPDTVAKGLRKAAGLSSDAPMHGAFWRCAEGKVKVCYVGANLPCQSKADTSKTPSAAINDFCKANANIDVVPAVVTGRATVYEWICRNGTPQVGNQLSKVDKQGFFADIWCEIAK